MKQFYSSLIASLRHYSSNATYYRTKWRSSSSNYKYKSRRKDPSTPKDPKHNITEEEKQVLSAIDAGKSVFITGSAGTGKTTLLLRVIRKLKKIHGKSRVYVTASTGVAACALNGSTLHSFSGTGLGEADRESLLQRVISNRQAYYRWNKVKALVIDEISMIDAEFFGSLQYIAKTVRDKEPADQDKVWGGIQLVVSGDFFQLPPVNVTKYRKNKKKMEFAFEADCWNASFDLQIELTNIFRQSDSHLIKLLQGIRRGESDPNDLKLLEQCSSVPEVDHSTVQLFPRVEDVKRVNKKQLLSLREEIIVYTALDSGFDPWKKQLKLGIAPDRLELCIGARVMLCKNIKVWNKLVNGATGTIVGFHDDDDSSDNFSGNYESGQILKNDSDIRCICNEGSLLPVVKFDCGQELEIGLETWSVMDGEREVARRKQIPLVLAWALSIHKCQGMTLNSLHTDLRRAFGSGMVYVALSRVKNLEGLHLSGFNPSKIHAHPKVLQFYKNLSCDQDW